MESININLPIEVIEMIIKNLNIIDVFRCRRVCKDWKYFCERHLLEQTIIGNVLHLNDLKIDQKEEIVACYKFKKDEDLEIKCQICLEHIPRENDLICYRALRNVLKFFSFIYSNFIYFAYIKYFSHIILTFFPKIVFQELEIFF
jgi:hypothetical protein